MQIMKTVEFIGMSSLIGFTSVITALAVIGNGACIYFYEPNQLVLIAEVLLGGTGITVGFKKIKELRK